MWIIICDLGSFQQVLFPSLQTGLQTRRRSTCNTGARSAGSAHYPGTPHYTEVEASVGRRLRSEDACLATVASDLPPAAHPTSGETHPAMQPPLSGLQAERMPGFSHWGAKAASGRGSLPPRALATQFATGVVETGMPTAAAAFEFAVHPVLFAVREAQTRCELMLLYCAAGVRCLAGAIIIRSTRPADRQLTSLER